MKRPPRAKYELEVAGVIVARRFRYESIRKIAATYDSPWEIFTYRKSRMANCTNGTLPVDNSLTQRAYELRCQGMAWRLVAKAVGVREGTLKARVRTLCGLPDFPRPGIPVGEIARMVQQGKTHREIARELRIAPSTVYRKLKIA